MFNWTKFFRNQYASTAVHQEYYFEPFPVIKSCEKLGAI